MNTPALIGATATTAALALAVCATPDTTDDEQEPQL